MTVEPQNVVHRGSFRVQDQVAAVSADLRAELTTMRALLILDLLDPRSTVEWATEKLSQGVDLLGIVGLAAVSEPTRAVVHAAMEEAADELGLEPLTEEGAGIIAATWEAGEVGTRVYDTH